MSITTLSIGFLVSFLGQLPIGSINLIAVQIAYKENFKKGFEFALGISIVEMIYLRIILSTIHLINLHSQFFLLAKYLIAGVLLYLAYNAFRMYKNEKQVNKSIQLSTNNRFFYGIFLSAINLAQLPFWFLWATFCLHKNFLIMSFEAYNIFTIGTGIGTILGLFIYLLIGKYLMNKVVAIAKHLQLFISIFFVIAAIAILFN